MIEFIKYSIAGLINAATGYGVFFAMIKLTDFSPEIANAVCYIVSIFFAFLLNRFFVFKGSKISKHTILRYISAFTSAFIINQVVFFILFRIFFLKPEIAQIFSMTSYSTSFFLLNKYFVFKKNKRVIFN
ncbi:MAG: GtrA family protein [Chlorobiaceae bacterium]